MRRAVLSPKWLVGHLVVAALAVVFVRLGWWQFDRSRAAHWSPQNLGYALQWPMFAAFGVLMWVRVVRDAQRPDGGARPVDRRPARRAPAPAATTPVAADDEDPELAAYNRYLARLDEQDRQRQERR